MIAFRHGRFVVALVVGPRRERPASREERTGTSAREKRGDQLLM
jgi:hypothetical protein